VAGKGGGQPSGQRSRQQGTKKEERQHLRPFADEENELDEGKGTNWRPQGSLCCGLPFAVAHRRCWKNRQSRKNASERKGNEKNLEGTRLNYYSSTLISGKRKAEKGRRARLLVQEAVLGLIFFSQAENLNRGKRTTKGEEIFKSTSRRTQARKHRRGLH